MVYILLSSLLFLFVFRMVVDLCSTIRIKMTRLLCIMLQILVM